MLSGGEGEIRTPETLSDLHAFQACALGHYATSPCKSLDVRNKPLDSATAHKAPSMRPLQGGA